MNLVTSAPVPSTPAPNASAAPAAPIAPEYVRLTWVSSRLGVSTKHELDVDFREAGEARDTHVYMSTLPNVELPIWFGAKVFAEAANDGHRAALRDALTGSGLLDTAAQDTLIEPRKGQLQVVYGTGADGFQPTFTGELKQLTPELQIAWDAAQRYLDDAKVDKKVGPGDLGKD